MLAKQVEYSFVSPKERILDMVILNEILTQYF